MSAPSTLVLTAKRCFGALSAIPFVGALAITAPLMVTQPAYSASPLCPSSGNSQEYESVSRLKIDTTEFAIPTAGYHDTSDVSAGTLQAGQAYPVEVNVETDGDEWEEWVIIWLDLNQDGEIDEVGEEIYRELKSVVELKRIRGR